MLCTHCIRHRSFICISVNTTPFALHYRQIEFHFHLLYFFQIALENMLLPI